MDFQGFGWLGVCSPKPHIPEGSRGMGRGSRRAEGLRFVEHWQRTLVSGTEGSGLALLCNPGSTGGLCRSQPVLQQDLQVLLSLWVDFSSSLHGHFKKDKISVILQSSTVTAAQASQSMQVPGESWCLVFSQVLHLNWAGKTL